MRMRGETPTLAGDVGNLVQIHQREHYRVEHGQHLSHRREAHATPIFSQGGIAAPGEEALVLLTPMFITDAKEAQL